MSKKITFCLSDSRNVNSHGFRMSLEGMNITRFASNPIMLYQHDTERIIGKWDNLRVEDGRLLAEPVFDLEDEEAKKVADKVERGFLRGCSIGVIVRQMDEDEQDGTLTASASELLEASIVSIPADAGAVRLFDEERHLLSAEAIPTYLSATINHNNQMSNPKQTSETENLAKLQTDLETKATEVATLAAQIADLKAEQESKDKTIAELTAKIAEMVEHEHKNYLDKAVKEGRISKEERDNFAILMNDHDDIVKSIIDGRPAKAQMSLAETIKNLGAADGEKANWTLLDWMRNDNAGLQKLRTENPMLFAKLKEDAGL